MRISLLLALILFSGTTIAAEPFDRGAWQQDYVQLKTELTDRYSNLAWKASGAGGVDLPALDRKTTAALASASDDAEAADAIRAFITGFHDGHLSELPLLAAASAQAIEPEKPTLSPDASAGGCASLGYASTAPVAFSLPLEGLPSFQLVSDGLGSTFRTGLVVRSGVRLGVIRIQAFRARAFPASCLHAWADLRRAGRAITPETIMEAARMRWFQDMTAAVTELRQAGATALVIDIGNNSGGDDSGDWTARLFTDHAVRSARLLMVDAPLAAGYFDSEVSDIDAALPSIRPPAAKAALAEARSFFVDQKNSIGQHRCDLSWSWRERRPWSPLNCNRLLTAGYAGGYSAGLQRGAYGSDKTAGTLASSSIVDAYYGTWSGPTYVLADRRSYSSAEMFAAVMQDNHIAKLVGDRTGGDGCGFMTDGVPIVLRHSRLRFRVPNCMRLRADGSNEEAGIAPDLPVLPTEGESDRARGERALRLIAEDVSSKPIQK
ncbi:S41 family peptidase [Dyella koreensis]|uniref:S41 family peptidase n=1 Tax=Dyella koreensis TaxID=311235 RepID=A0ABW8KC58_9GAMM